VRFNRKQIIAAGLVSALALTGCSKTFQRRSGIEKSGFLRDYSQLQEGQKGQAALVYINAAVNWADYNKILLDPVSVWSGPDGKLSKVPKDQMQALLNYFDAAIRKQLEGTYKFVERPEPGTIHLRVALTEADKSRVVLNLVSTIVPQARTVDTLQSFATGTYGFSGDTQAEMEALDAMTNDRLAAAVDRQSGGKSLSTKFDSWGDVKAAMDAWAKQMADRLAQLRTAGPNPDVH
jgi:hypothetical protein